MAFENYTWFAKRGMTHARFRKKEIFNSYAFLQPTLFTEVKKLGSFVCV